MRDHCERTNVEQYCTVSNCLSSVGK